MSDPQTAPDTQLPIWRLWLLRAMYLLISGGLAVYIWPSVVTRITQVPHMNSVVLAMLAALSLLAALGLRYPVRMLPVLLFELLWKSLWLLLVALPKWLEGPLDPAVSGTLSDCLPAVILLPLVLPWPHLWREYVRKPAERWK